MNKSESILKTIIKNKIKQYIKWNIEQTRNLIINKQVCPKTKYIKPILDVPIMDNLKDYRVFFELASRCGYKNFNIGLTSLWNRKIPLEITGVAKQYKVHFLSSHGTSIKKAINNPEDYQYFLKKDLEILDKIDPKKKMINNYDLFAGHASDLIFNSNFNTTKRKNCEQISKKLGVANYNTKFFLADTIINNLTKIFGNSGRKITLEIPGTKGWSMLTEINEEYLNYLLEQINNQLPQAKITLDLAHILTWFKKHEDIDKLVELIKKHRNTIFMLHISSAGSDNKIFSDIYRSVYGEIYPGWHIKSLDLSLFVYEKEMIHLLKKIRGMVSHELYEVVETRLPSAAIADYFPEYKTQEFDNLYFDGLLLQSKLLGYY